MPCALKDPEEGKTLPGRGSLPVSYEGVDFSYLPGKPVLKGFDFRIPAGQKVGIVGTSGSGKTTLVNLLLRFYDVCEGKVSVGGADVRDLAQETLRSNMAHVSQDTTLFHRSIRENIRYSKPDASDGEVERAAKMAHAHEFIVSLPNGYDTMVGDR